MVHRNILQYQIGEKIGVGGMGEVYKARDTRLNRFVAMKVLSAGMSADADRRRRFIQEAQAVSALNHPNIITIYDVVNDGDTQFMVVEYVDGKTLQELIPQGGLPAPQAVGYAVQIAEALCAAHAAGIVHRDLKPSNVMVTHSGLVKVLDFGLAKMVEWPAVGPDASTVTQLSSPLTVEGTILGTVNYMSPEQAEGKKLDPRSDIFSFGTVLYEMITGQAAFLGDTMVATLTALLRDDVRPARELAPTVPPELERIVTECLRKKPELRVQSMQDVRIALTGLKRQLDTHAFMSVPASAVPPAARPPRRGAGMAVFVVLLLAALGGAYWWSNNNSPAPVPAHPKPPATSGSVTAPPTESPAPVPVAPKPDTATTVIVDDGLRVPVKLAEDIPATAAAGDSLFFEVEQEVRVEGKVMIHKGANAVGSIVDGPKKKFMSSAKMTFRFIRVDAVDGRKLTIRVTRSPSEQSKRPVAAVTAGTAYEAYIDGPQSVTVKE